MVHLAAPTSGRLATLHFHYALGFATRTLVHVLDSLVRVSRRVSYNHFVSVSKALNTPPECNAYSCDTASCPTRHTPQPTDNSPIGALSIFLDPKHCKVARAKRSDTEAPNPPATHVVSSAHGTHTDTPRRTGHRPTRRPRGEICD